MPCRMSSSRRPIFNKKNLLAAIAGGLALSAFADSRKTVIHQTVIQWKNDQVVIDHPGSNAVIEDVDLNPSWRATIWQASRKTLQDVSCGE